MTNVSRDWPGQAAALLFMLVWIPLFAVLVTVGFCIMWVGNHLEEMRVRLLYALFIPALFLTVCVLIGVQLPLETLVLISPAVISIYVLLSVVANATKRISSQSSELAYSEEQNAP